jgi:hypothetical protein
LSIVSYQYGSLLIGLFSTQMPLYSGAGAGDGRQ